MCAASVALSLYGILVRALGQREEVVVGKKVMFDGGEGALIAVAFGSLQGSSFNTHILLSGTN